MECQGELYLPKFIQPGMNELILSGFKKIFICNPQLHDAFPPTML